MTQSEFLQKKQDGLKEYKAYFTNEFLKEFDSEMAHYFKTTRYIIKIKINYRFSFCFYFSCVFFNQSFSCNRIRARNNATNGLVFSYILL